MRSAGSLTSASSFAEHIQCTPRKILSRVRTDRCLVSRYWTVPRPLVRDATTEACCRFQHLQVGNRLAAFRERLSGKEWKTTWRWWGTDHESLPHSVRYGQGTNSVQSSNAWRWAKGVRDFCGLIRPCRYENLSSNPIKYQPALKYVGLSFGNPQPELLASEL